MDSVGVFVENVQWCVIFKNRYMISHHVVCIVCSRYVRSQLVSLSCIAAVMSTLRVYVIRMEMKKEGFRVCVYSRNFAYYVPASKALFS